MLRGKNTRRWVLAGGAGLALVLGAGAYSASAAPTAQTRSGQARTAHATKVSNYGILIGPLNGRGGFRATIEADGCGTRNSLVDISYQKGNARTLLEHTYLGKATCTVSKTLNVATLKLKWGTAVTLAVTTGTTSRLVRFSADDGCKSNYVELRGARTLGTGRLAIHTRQFGTLTLRRDAIEAYAQYGTCSEGSGSATGGGAGTRPISGGGTGFHIVSRPGDAGLTAATLARAAGLRAALAQRATGGAHARDRPATMVPTSTTTAITPTTTTTTASTTTTPVTTTAPTTTTAAPAPTVTPDKSGSQFVGLFDGGAFVASAYTESRHSPLILLQDLAPRDAPARGVVAETQVVFQVPQDFTLGSGDDTAELAAANPFASGTIDFIATAFCSGSTKALDGKLTGTITIRDPVIGTISFNGPRAVGAAVGDNDASLETC